MTLTKPQQRALNWLREHGGSGVIDQYGRILAGGEHSGQHSATFLRLCASGHCYGENGRIYVSEETP